VSPQFGPGHVALLTGPPGAGKTTVAEHVARLVSPSVVLAGDTFFRSLRSGRIPPWEPAANAQNTTLVTALGAAAAACAGGGFAVVVEGIVGPWMLEPFQLACPIPLHYVVLRPSAAVAMARATGRSGEELVDPVPIAAMYDAFADLGEHEADVVDSSDLSVEATAAAVAGRLGLAW
jgi:cytidylate kinase